MFSYTIWPEHSLISMWNRGETPVDEFRQGVKRMHMDPGFVPEYDVLMDFTEQEQHYTPDDVRQLAASLPRDRPIRNAIVAPQDVSYGLSRMYEALTEPLGKMQIGVFRTPVEALEWLRRDASILADLEAARAAYEQARLPSDSADQPA